MSSYFPAFALVLLGLILGLKGATSSLKKLGGLRTDLAARHQQITLAEAAVTTREQWLLDEARVADLSEFGRRWRPEIERLHDLAGITQVVNSEAEALQLPVQEQRTEDGRGEASTAGRKKPGVVGAVRYSVTVTGNLAATLRWLGRIEEILPLARAERVDITPSQDWVVLRCTLAIPELSFETPST